ncbi:hypothetical protein D3C72_1720970 [compost metagenome]
MYRDQGQEPVHVALQERLRAFIVDRAVGIDQAILEVDERLWLAKHVHVQEGQAVAQVLLGHRRADLADGGADHRRRLAGEGTVAVGARADVDRILQHAWHGTVVLGGNEQHGVGGAHLVLQARALRRVTGVEVLVIERQVADLHVLEARLVAGQLLQRVRQLAVAGLFAQAADENGNGGDGHQDILLTVRESQPSGRALPRR